MGKRNIVFVLMVIFLVGLLNGCSSSSSSSSSSSKKTVPDEIPVLTKPNVAAVPKTLSFLCNQQHSQSRQTTVFDEINKRLRGNLNINLCFLVANYPHFSYALRNNSDFNLYASAYFYDERQFVNPDTSDVYLNLDTIVKSGSAMDLTDLLPQYAPNIYKKLSKEQLLTVTVDGKLSAIPSLFPRSNRCCAIVRKDLMDKYKISPIKDLDDYEAFLKVIHDKEPGLVPVAKSNILKGLVDEAGGYVSLDYLSKLVYKWDDGKMKLSFYDQVPLYSKYAKMIKSWENSGFFKNLEGTEINADDGTLKYPKNSSMTASVLGYPDIDNYFWDDSNLQESITWNADNGTITYPLFPDKIVQRVSPSDKAIVLVANPRLDTVKETLQFLDWVQSSQENYDLLMYGIKGEDYTLYGQQYIPQKVDKVFGESEYIRWPESMAFWNLDFLRTSVKNSPDSKENYKNLVELNSKYAPHIGFCPDYTQITNEIALLNDVDLKPTEEVREKILTEIQNQLDLWIKNNKG
jgi:ABC-type glycerol-3-phosphate transport system substrate-binding protein